MNNPIAFIDQTGEWFGIDDVITGPVDEIVVIGGLFVLSLFGVQWADDFIDATADALSDMYGGILDFADVAPETPDDNSKTEESESYKIPDVEYPGDDPTVAPEGYEWTGPDPQGEKRGGYKNKNPNKRDSWHPNLDHGPPKGPHWDYNDIYGTKWTIVRRLGRTVYQIWNGKHMIFEFIR